MSARYPGDAQDALFMDDGPSPNWWESPDIWLNAPNGTVANAGSNTVHVRLHLAAGKTFSPSQAQADVYVGNPSLVMTPTAGTASLGSVLIARTDFPMGGGATEKQLTWNVAVDPSRPGDPDQPGHRCLITRVYPFGSATPSDFDVPNDPHEAQRNICVVNCADSGAPLGGAGAGMAGAPGGEPMGPGADGMWEFRVDTTSRLIDHAELVTLRAIRPSLITEATARAALPILARSGFGGFAHLPPQRFQIGFDLPDEALPRWAHRVVGDEVERVALDQPWRPTIGAVRETMVRRVAPWARATAALPGFLRRTLGSAALLRPREPRYDLGLELMPGHVARFGFKVDLRTTPVGQAQVFHLQQVGANGRVQGGLTLIFHRQG